MNDTGKAARAIANWGRGSVLGLVCVTRTLIGQTPTGLSPTGIPLAEGLRISSALHFPMGDRENVVTVTDVSSDGAAFVWHLREQHRDGKSLDRTVGRYVSEADLRGAPRLNPVFEDQPRAETPGYTALSLSRAAFARLNSTGSMPFTITDLQRGPFSTAFVDLTSARMSYKGILTRTARDSMPILLDGIRTRVPAIHVQGKFTLQDKSFDADYWVLADSTNPLLLRGVSAGEVFQVVRIDRPRRSVPPILENGLTKECRAELPGVYFAFASAELDADSKPALSGVAALLARHKDWTLSIEGHTDSIGKPEANRTLSEQRAAAVRTALTAWYHVDPARLRAVGFGDTRPRESNATIEGRARNRRVEVVRPCGT